MALEPDERGMLDQAIDGIKHDIDTYWNSFVGSTKAEFIWYLRGGIFGGYVELFNVNNDRYPTEKEYEEISEVILSRFYEIEDMITDYPDHK